MLFLKNALWKSSRTTQAPSYCSSFSVPEARQYLRNLIDLVYIIKIDFKCINHLSHIYVVIVASQIIQIKKLKK